MSVNRLLLVLPVPIVVLAGWAHRWVADDGFINLRVVENLLAGNGPVFNAGERVEVATSPLWVALVAVAGLVVRHLEWVVVVLGLLLAAIGLGLAQLGAARLARRRGPDRLLPLGAVVVAALPPFWHFATSGLETGLTFAWLGACFHGLARRADPRRRTGGWAPAGLAVATGLGPLVRPDAAVFSAAFLVALLAGAPRREQLRMLAWAAALPVAYQIFRMGYYGLLTPNTALAKEASRWRPDQGLAYAADLLAPYHLWVPLALALVAGAGLVAGRWRAGDRAGALVALAPMGGAALHAGYVVAVGGDFMHARLLLPALFAVVMPVAVVAVPVRRPPVAVVAVVAWAALAGLALRVPYAGGVSPLGISDERGYYANVARDHHPVTLDDYAGWVGWRHGQRMRALAADDAGLMSVMDRASGRAALLPLTPSVPFPAATDAITIGVIGQSAGLDVFVADRVGLADPIAGRLRLERRARPGHEKRLADSWLAARFLTPEAALPGRVPAEEVAAARRALACPPLRELGRAVGDPLTPRRFLANLVAAPRLQQLRIDADPVEAADRLCP